MDLWRSGEQFVWIMPQEAKLALLKMREQYRDHRRRGRPVSSDRFTEHYRLLSADPDMRARLLADPKAALAEYFGAILDGDYRIEVIEQRPDTITAVLPTPPEPGTDPAARLADVSGRIYDMLHTTGIGGYLVPDEALTWVLRDMRALWASRDSSANNDEGKIDVNVRDAFYQVLRSHGITTIFGNPGSNELPLLRDFPDDFRYVLALQEGAAIGMADGYALATGRPSLVNLHAAAGTGNAMGNLTNTQSGHVPVVVTSGQQARRYTALNAMLTNVDATTLPKPLVKWSNEPLRPEDVPQALSQGILLAAVRPGRPGLPLPAAGRLGP